MQRCYIRTLLIHGMTITTDAVLRMEHNHKTRILQAENRNDDGGSHPPENVNDQMARTHGGRENPFDGSGW
jgi:hypothetical protein